MMAKPATREELIEALEAIRDGEGLVYTWLVSRGLTPTDKFKTYALGDNCKDVARAVLEGDGK